MSGVGLDGIDNGANIDGNNTPTELEDFQKSIKDKAPEELGRSLADPNLDPWQKQAVIRELTDDLTRRMSDPATSPEEQKDIKKILEDLTKSGGAGENGMKDISKMLQALGVPSDVAEAIVHMMAGKDYNGM